MAATDTCEWTQQHEDWYPGCEAGRNRVTSDSAPSTLGWDYCPACGAPVTDEGEE